MVDDTRVRKMMQTKIIHDDTIFDVMMLYSMQRHHS